MTMTPEEREAFVARPLTAVLSTLLPNGRIHAVPVWYRYANGVFIVITGRGSQKARNVARIGRAALCIDERDGIFRYVTVEAAARVLDRVTYDERLALHTLYRGEERAKRTVADGAHERMVQLVLTPERWLSA